MVMVNGIPFRSPEMEDRETRIEVLTGATIWASRPRS
jgi:hypothetical protein